MAYAPFSRIKNVRNVDSVSLTVPPQHSLALPRHQCRNDTDVAVGPLDQIELILNSIALSMIGASPSIEPDVLQKKKHPLEKVRA